MSMMSVRPVGPYPNAYSAPAYNAQPAAQAAVQPSTTATPTGGAASSGLNIGRLASWAGGGWLGFRVAETVMRSRPEGWLLAGVVGAGAFVGNKIYNTVTGSGSGLSMPSANGNTGRYLAWGAGAFGAWKWVAPMINMTRGWGLGAVVAGGAFAGNWIYNKLTGR